MAAHPQPPTTPPPPDSPRATHASSGALTLSRTSIVPSALQIPRRVRIVEVGPRDGLQGESMYMPAADKIRLVDDLVSAGLSTVEVTAFVSPKRVPQLRDAADVMRGIRRTNDVTYIACVPNMRGWRDALAAGARDIALLAAATEAFSRRNIGCGIDEAVSRYGAVIRAARASGARVRAYVSCALGCPYSGEVTPAAVARVAARLYAAGCGEVALGDTIGAGNPRTVVDVISAVVRAGVPVDKIAVHFHDTRGTALANVLAAISVGVATIDSSIAGLGGCPFAPGSAGNIATEDLVHMLQGMRVDVGDVDLSRLIHIGDTVCKQLGVENRSRVAHAARSNQSKAQE